MNRVLMSSRSDLHRMAGEGQDPSQFLKNTGFRAHQGPLSLGNRTNSGYRPPYNKHIISSRESSSGTRGEQIISSKMTNPSGKLKMEQMTNLPQISMARGTINNRNKINLSKSDLSTSPRHHLGPDRSQSRG